MNSKLLAGILVSFVSVQSLSASARNPAQVENLSSSPLKQQGQFSNTIEYVPPVNRNPKKTEGTGSRGCGELLASINPITLLIPAADYVGQTSSEHPRFVWYFSEPISLPVEFMLTEEGSAEALFHARIETPLSGLVSLEMPDILPPLKVDTPYQWSVNLLCDQEPIAFNISWIERVEMSSPLAQQLEATQRSSTAAVSWQSSPERQQAMLYAKEGLWYDALGILVAAQKDYPRDRFLEQDLLQLLEQVGLQQTREGITVNP